jgi:hypothetical protein
MKKHIWILVIFSATLSSSYAQTGQTTYKNKGGNKVGSAKQSGDKTIYYNKQGNKTGSAKTNNGQTTYYNKQGNKVGTSKTK